MKIAVTFSGLDPSRLAERIQQRLREREAARTTYATSSPDDADLPPASLSRPPRRRPRRDRRS